VLRAFVQDEKFPAKTPFVKKGYDKLFSYQQIDTGGIYQDLLANYNTAIAVSAIAAANEPAYKERLDRAVAFLKKLQWTEGPRAPRARQSRQVERLVRRLGLRQSRAARFVQRADLHPGAARRRSEAGRQGVPGCAGFPVAHAEQLRDQRPALAGDDGGFFTLREQRRLRSRRNDRSTAAGVSAVRLDDLRGPEKHDLRRLIEGRSARESRGRLDHKHWTLEENPAMREAAISFARTACITTTTPSPTRWTRTMSRSSPMRKARRTTGGAS
jgi:hypothetical protein